VEQAVLFKEKVRLVDASFLADISISLSGCIDAHIVAK
jgi:hypothetical protein